MLCYNKHKLRKVTTRNLFLTIICIDVVKAMLDKVIKVSENTAVLRDYSTR